MQTAAGTLFPPRSRILVRGVNWLGDAVMSTSALLRLREAYPEAAISLLTAEKLADLWPGHPAVDQVLTFAPQDNPLSIGRRLREHEFNVGLIFPNSFRSALELWWARVPHRIGHRGQLRRWLLTSVAPERPGAVPMRKRTRREIIRQTSSERLPPAGTGAPRAMAGPPKETANRERRWAHHVHQYLHLVAQLGGKSAPVPPRLFVGEDEIERWCQDHQMERNSERPLFGLNPGAEYGPAKRWPADRFIAAAREIQTHTGCRWLVFGGKGDQLLASQITAGTASGRRPKENSVLNLAGATSLRQLCVGLAACRVVLTNDTGPMHVAAALGIPVVVPFGSTSPFLTAPGLPGDHRHRFLSAAVPCAPCFLRECPIDFRCMRQITVESVVDAVLNLWRRDSV